MNVLDWALNHAIKVSNLLPPENEEDKKRGFTRRASNFPSLLTSAGLIPAITFYMAKAKEEKYTSAYKYLKGEEIADDVLKDELSTEESAGYSLYLACVADALKRACEELCNYKEEPEDLKKLVAMLKKIRKEGKSLLLEKIIQEYSIEMKKLAEALIG